MNYEEALPQEFEEELAKCPVAYLPWGALEWHGQHLPLGLDSLKAHTLCQLVADTVGGIVVPPVWCGFSTLAENGLPHTLEFRRDTVMLLLREYLEQLAKVGFKLIVVLTGHYGPKHVAALVEAANTFTLSGAYPDAVIWVLPEYELARKLGYHGDHAAKWETSIMMRLRPELVKIERLDDAAALEGIGGEDPRGSASTELGAQAVRAIVDNLSRRVAEFIESRSER